MKRIQRIIAALLCCCLLFGCSGAPASSVAADSSSGTAQAETEAGPVSFPLSETAEFNIGTIVMDGAPSNAECKFWLKREEETNVHVEWEETLFSAWTTKKAAVLSAGDLPDAFILRGLVTDEEVASYGAAGTFIKLQDYITPEIMPNLAGYLEEHPDWKTAITAPDGNIYSLPSIDATAYTADSILYVNKDWAAQVMQDLDLTQPMDLETFEALLTAFKNSDPNGNGKADEIPWSVGGNGVDFLRWSGSFGIFDSYSAPNNTSHLYLDGDTVKYAPMQEGYKEFVKWLNGLWSKGLIDVEAFTQDSATLSAKQIDTERILGYMYCWRNSAWALSDDDDTYVVTPPLDTGISDPTWINVSDVTFNRGTVMLTSECEDPELLLSWIDLCYEPYNSLQLNTAQFDGEHIKKNDDGTFTQLRAIDWNLPDESTFMPNNYAKIYILTPETFAKQDVKPPVYIQKHPIDEMMSEYYSDTLSLLPTSIWLTEEDGKQVAIYRTDLDAYILDCFARWVTTGGIDEEWDAYVTKLSEMGADDLVNLYQSYYDAL